MIDMKISTCEECESEYYEHTSKIEDQCPNCNFYLHGYKNCDHQFENGRCIKCYWNGEIPSHIESIIQRTANRMKGRKSISVSFNIYDVPKIKGGKDPYLTFLTANKNKTVEIFGNKSGLRLMAKALLGIAETRDETVHEHIDDIYNINEENKEFIINRVERGWREEE